MTTNTQLREMTKEERNHLERLANSAATKTKRWLEGAVNALVLWAVYLLLFALAWTLSAWLLGAAFDVNLGWKSPAAPWILAACVPSCAVVAIVSSVRWVKGSTDIRPLLLADLKDGRVVEERYSFTASKRFQEPEHGGLMYFLRTTDDKVLTLFDYESQNLGVDRQDPLKSGFRPLTKLLMVRAPQSRVVINQEFSGSLLNPGDPQDLAAPPELWPDSESYCNIPWDDLEKRLSLR